MSADGKRVAIGATGNDGTGLDAGHVRVYAESGGTWTQVGADIDGEAAGDESGGSAGGPVSMSADGTRVAIGATGNDGTGLDAGHVRVYAESGGTWTQVGADIDGEAAGDRFGYSLSMSADGTRAAIGARYNDGTGLDAGHVRVYAESGGTWTQVGADIDGEATGDKSGRSVSMSADGKRVAIGATGNDGNGSVGSLDAGHVRVYAESGGTWTQVGADIDGEAADDSSGRSVSMSADGTRVAIGADDAGFDAGHVRVYAESGGTWTQVGADIDGEAAGDKSGKSVSMSANGTRVAIGAIGNDGTGSDAGHVRVYAESGGTWTQVGTDIDGEAAGDRFGQSVSMSADGTHVAIGAPGNGGTGNVRVYVTPPPSPPPSPSPPPPPSPPPNSSLGSSSNSPLLAIVIALVVTPSTIFSVLFFFFKPFLRRLLLSCGCIRVADCVVPADAHKLINALQLKVSEIENFMAKQKLPRLRDTAAEIQATEVQLHENEILGVGGYGTVYKATYKNKTVAVKTVFAETTGGAISLPKAMVANMRKEAIILSSLNHPNILRVLGIVPDLAWIIMEYCPRGSLQDALLNEDAKLSDEELLRFASQVATGVAYLHMPNVSIVHGDLKAANALLADDGGVRLCDFGMSQAKNRSKTLTMASHAKNKGHALTVAWSAPELFNDEPKSFASDVYALGVTMWEIFERRTPFGNMPEAAVVSQVLTGKRPVLRQTPAHIQTLVQLTWTSEPASRIGAAQVACVLSKAHEKVSQIHSEEV
jgi:tRNA A-37 threonylcarbamoyl transferase component Bud32